MNRNIKILISSSITGLFVFFYILISETGMLRLSGKIIDYLIFFLFLTLSIGYSLSFINNRIEQKSRLKEDFVIWFFIVLIINIIISFFILIVFAKAFNLLYYSNIDFITFFSRNKNLSLKIAVLSVLLLVVYIISDYSIYSYNKYLNVKIHGEKLSADKLHLHFEALENQLKPHYLFNNLNTVVSLIYSDKQLAENYVRQLSNTYKYVLACKNKKTISLKNELDFIRAYSFLMKTRYKESLFININITDDEIKGLIVPLSLQILVENAIKHNKINESKPLEILVFIEDDYVIVENNLNGIIDSVTLNNRLITNVNKVESHKIGLQNIQKRYELLSDKKVFIRKTNKFRVEIPILNSVIKNA